MIIGNITHRRIVIDVLSASFDDNKSINYIVRQGSNRTKRIRLLMGYCFDVCLSNGHVYVSDDEYACALVLCSEKTKVSIRRNLSLIFNCTGLLNVIRVLRREKLLKSHHPMELFYHLWFIGVIPIQQNKGIGSKLLGEVLESCDVDRRPVYLETSVLRNIPWYQQHGFKTFHELSINYTLYQMIRE